MALCLQSLLDAFEGHNVDTAASAVEAAGRYLYLLPETAQRMANMLEVLPYHPHALYDRV